MAANVCCSGIPPVVTSDYKPKGTYSKIGDTKVYVTGPENATRGLFTVFDVFGYFPQTLQGADLIATALGIKVVIPDLFDGQPMDINIYPPDTEEKKQKVSAFFSSKAQFQPNVERVRSLVTGFKSEYNIEKWSIMGLCWGGKVTTLSSLEGTPFVSSLQVHPAFLDPNDAGNVAIPHICLASNDENPKHVAEFKQRIENHPNSTVRGKSVVKTYEGMFHGWMGARAKLHEEKYKNGYEKGYAEVVSFLRNTLLAESLSVSKP